MGNQIATEGQGTKGLALYGFRSCPYCQRVLRAIDQLGLDLEFRDTMGEDDHDRALREATGRSTVPVLRIEDESGSVRWLPESLDIIEYLEERFS